MAFTPQQYDQLANFHEAVMAHQELFQPETLFDEKQFHAKDLLNLPTIVTLGSLGLVLNGCRSIETVSGVNQIILGRTGDLLDGYLARLLDQVSDAGAFVDTAADKLGILAIASAAWRKDAIPKPVIATVIGKQTASVGLTAITAIRHPDASFRPTITGKQAMFADNAAFIGYMYSHALERNYPQYNLHQGARLLGHSAFAIGTGLSVPAMTQYTRRAFS